MKYNFKRRNTTKIGLFRAKAVLQPRSPKNDSYHNTAKGPIKLPKKYPTY